jgi:hypothetical protein
MRVVVGGNEGIPSFQDAALTIDDGFKRARDNKADLVVYVVCVWGADSAFVKLHEHRHELGRMADDLAADAVAQLSPGGGVILKKVHKGLGVRQKVVNKIKFSINVEPCFGDTIAPPICFETVVH